MRIRLLVALACLTLAACVAPAPPSDADQPSAAASTSARPVAYINGELVTDATLRPSLMELAGGEVLSEVVLDAMIQRRLRRLGMTLSPQLVEAERAQLTEAMAPGDEDQATLLLRALRRRRGLGDTRFESLLRRNAGLRLLVQDQVEVTPQAVRQAYELTYGPTYTARILVSPSVREAQQLRRRLAAGEASFADLAVAHSTDPSSVQGGLLAPISPVDPAYPPIIRDTLVELDRTGERLSGVVALDGGYALLRLERKTRPEPVELTDVEDQLRRQVRRRIERVLMQQLAREMLAQANVTVLDPALDRSWRQRKEALLGESR